MKGTGAQLGQYPAAWHSASLRSDHLRGLLSSVGEDEFFDALEAEVARLNGQFQTCAKSIISAHHSLKHVFKLWSPFNKKKVEISVCSGAEHTKVEVKTNTIAFYAGAYIKFAKDNAVAIRSMIDEHHKRYSGERGQDYLKELWQDQSGRASFLHSPLLAELAAVELAWTVSNSCASDSEDCSNESKDGEADDSDLQCPICLDTLFKPIALACGHVFCQSCLFEACGHGSQLGTAQAILSCIPSATRCPECRSDNVVAGARQLKVLSTTLQQRFPEYWFMKEQEEKDNKTALQAQSFQLKVQKMRQVLTTRARFHPSMLILD
ncbi:unnamed protein product [Ostreobium quekettii]|uniref:RING-type domain-containing protein n=1 Tax=Ostreobium quekettii TaxID=121088 RepID=A0A8S1J7A4_9CHLO|nr:unnamed protein product [Ostreobium quekettii]|eukprot:evm.model.scf_1445.5 EVM.evm.TU.scf_1445.5   scf_1445:15834-17991(+)